MERIWTAVNDSAQYKSLSQSMALLIYDVLAKRTQLLSVIDNVPNADPQTLKNIARDERPFVPEIAWAYYSAFTSVLAFNVARFKILQSGIENPQLFISADYTRNILKAALPHRTQFIEEQDPSAYHYLLDEIEDKLLNELRKILDGKEADQSSIQHGSDLLSATRAAVAAQARDDIRKVIPPTLAKTNDC